jgi:hypothetical protein
MTKFEPSRDTKGAFPPSDFCNGYTDTLSVTHSEIPKPFTFLAYLTICDNLWQSVTICDKLKWSATESLWRIFRPLLKFWNLFLRGKFKQCLSLNFCPTDKLVYVETAELRYRRICTLAERLWQNPLQKSDGGNAPLHRVKSSKTAKNSQKLTQNNRSWLKAHLSIKCQENYI